MDNLLKNFLLEKFGISEACCHAWDAAEARIRPGFARLEEICAYNQAKVLAAFTKHNLATGHFAWHTGYGYDDPGRAITEKIFAEVLGAEAALVRTQIVNGTHALTLTLAGLLRPGDELIYVTGAPYDSMEETIGVRGEGHGSLKEYGVSYKQVNLTEDYEIDLDGVLAALGETTKMVCMQRSTGYAWRPALYIDEIEKVARAVKAERPDIIVMTDNCYGEFTDIKEPVACGVDIMAGSLIKNPGGGLALSGGYVAGRADLVDLITRRLYTPGIAGECGLTFGQTRNMLQGLFLGPSVVKNAISGAMVMGAMFQDLGYAVCPSPEQKRSDIVQAICLGSREAMVSFSKGIQSVTAVDSFAAPEPYAMPGYADEVIMAAGGFVGGSTMELSCDGPIRAPYTIYFQGGLTYDHVRIGAIKAMQQLLDDGLLNLG